MGIPWERLSVDEKWQHLARGKRFRIAFLRWYLKYTLGRQIRTMRKYRGWSQAELARRAGIDKMTVCRAEHMFYGRLSLNTLIRIAAAFDCALLCRFTSWGELLDPDRPHSDVVLSFDEECALIARGLVVEPTDESSPTELLNPPVLSAPATGGEP